MAIDRNSRYPGRFDAPTTARPQGAFKNRSAPGAKDGSYLERDWANDWDGFFGSLLRSAGLTPNGTPDTALASQYFDALGSLGLRQATESVTGVSKFSTLLMSLAGTDDTTSMTPAKVVAALSAFLPKRSFLANDFIRMPDLPGGLIVQFGKSAYYEIATELAVAVTYPTPFPNQVLTLGGWVNSQQSAIVSTRGTIALTGASFVLREADTQNQGGTFFWIAVGN